VRYPEYGPAAVAAVVVAHGIGGMSALGIAAGIGLVLALAGGVSLHWLHTTNGRAVHAATAALEAGDPRALARVHAGGLLRDIARAYVMTAAGLVVATLVTRLGTTSLPAPVLIATSVAAGGVALATGTTGLLRLVGRGPNLKWLAAGAVAGIALVWLA
jgi:mannose/fructose/N-acetylgalactosamine-specific phosphotransferase system component IIC